MLLETLQRKAAKRGFAWDDVAGPLAKLVEEVDELRAAVAGAGSGGDDEVARELGDVFGAAVAVARALDLDADAVARRAASRFRARFEAVLATAAADGVDLAELTTEEWLRRWAAAAA